MAAERIKRGYGMAAHLVRMRLLDACVEAGLLEVVTVTKRRLHGEGHHDYHLRLGDRELILLSGELEPFIAGLAWGITAAGGTPPVGITDVYRPDAPMRKRRESA